MFYRLLYSKSGLLKFKCLSSVTFTVYKIATYMAGGFLLSAMLILSNNHKCEGQNVA